MQDLPHPGEKPARFTIEGFDVRIRVEYDQDSSPLDYYCKIVWCSPSDTQKPHRYAIQRNYGRGCCWIIPNGVAVSSEEWHRKNSGKKWQDHYREECRNATDYAVKLLNGTLTVYGVTVQTFKAGVLLDESSIYGVVCDNILECLDAAREVVAESIGNARKAQRAKAKELCEQAAALLGEDGEQ